MPSTSWRRSATHGRPFEALAGLSDAQLEAPTDPAGPCHGWSARDLMGHLVSWQEHLLAMAKELAVNDASPTRERVEAAWAADPEGVNAASLAEWRALPLDEVRSRFSDRARRAARLPHGRARDALAQEPAAPLHLPRRQHRALPGPHRRAGGDPGPRRRSGHERARGACSAAWPTNSRRPTPGAGAARPGRHGRVPPSRAAVRRCAPDSACGPSVGALRARRCLDRAAVRAHA